MKREWLIAYRKAKNLSQLEIANALGIRQTTYSNYEIGFREPTPKLAKKIAKVLGFNWTKFYDENNSTNQNE